MHRALALSLITVSAILLFWRLDGVPLWRDEATTGVWSRAMVESGSGAPYVYRGGQLMAQADDGHDFNSRLLPAMQSYLQFYVAAGSFKLFGASDWSARLPFAAAGGATLVVLYRIGGTLFGAGPAALAAPALAVFSIFFLNAARQGRYYILVALAASLLLLEFSRYLTDSNIKIKRSFYIKIFLYGLLLYLANYVSFAGFWAALSLFVVIERDRRMLLGFGAVTAALAAVGGVEFWLLHSEFAAAWPPPEPRALGEIYQGALANRGRDIWRAIPLVFLVPAAFRLWLSALGGKRPSLPMRLGMASSVLIVLSPLALIDYAELREWAPPWAFWLFAAACLIVPLTLWFCWAGLEKRSPAARAALLAGLVLVVSPALTIALGKNKALTRHYYQILPASVILCSLAVAAIDRRGRNRAASLGLFAALALWPNLDLQMGGTDQVVQRQFTRDRSYNGPLIDFFSRNLQPGDKVAFVRNVKGMALYFQFPEMHWVELLSSEAPHNRRFRGVIADDQFDDARVADWYVVWDPRGKTPKGLDDSFEKVWEYSYSYLQSWWDRERKPTTRKYEVYRRR